MLTDGRDYVKETLPAWREALPDLELAVVDDSGDNERRSWLKDHADHLVSPGINRCGYTAAMRVVMGLAASSGRDHILLTEDDFLPIAIPDLSEVATIINEHELSQMSFRRQAWYKNEKRKGGILQAVATRAACNEMKQGHARWIEQSAYWTCNPSLFPRWVAERGWPDVKWSEKVFSDDIIADGYVAGVWGKWDDKPLTRHIGYEKKGTGY